MKILDEKTKLNKNLKCCSWRTKIKINVKMYKKMKKHKTKWQKNKQNEFIKTIIT